ncbi:MAG TPA: DUF6491 family protein [Xanthomonadaceae bacterium]|nr:DUF6491 family protein [Xanthomonadaceae bacterium]
MLRPHRWWLPAALALITAAAPASDRHAPLRPVSDCLDPDRARGWVMVSSDELLVDAGRRHYRIMLSYACPELGTSTALAFEAGAVSRVCGDIGESVRPLDRLRGARACDIARVERIEADEYRERSAGGSVSGRIGRGSNGG